MTIPPDLSEVEKTEKVPRAISFGQIRKSYQEMVEDAHLGDADHKTVAGVLKANETLALLNSAYGQDCLKEGRLLEAELCLGSALALSSHQAQVLNNLGICFYRQKKMPEAGAHFREAIRLDEKCFPALNNLGNVFVSIGRTDLAIKCFTQALAVQPSYAEARQNLGLAWCKLEDYPRALECFQAAQQLRPNEAETVNNLGWALLKMGQAEDAIGHFRQAIRLNPTHFQAHNNLGVALESFESVENLEEAQRCYGKAIELAPDFPDAHNNLGNILYWLGRKNEAQQAYSRAIRLAPRRTDFYRNLSESWQFTAEDDHLKALQALAREKVSLSSNDQMHLHYALGKAQEDLQCPEEAFQHFLAANLLKRRRVYYNEKATLEFFTSLSKIFDAEFIGSRSGQGTRSERPIFVVGMMRSGTSLIEQILASHPQVFGAGERKDFEEGLRALVFHKDQLDPLLKRADLETLFPMVQRNWAPSDLQWLGERYLQNLRKLAQGDQVTRVVDKMPSNFRFLGMIHLVFPNATIIHARRHPIETCLSSFSKFFVEDHPYTYDLAELGRYYRAYHELMAHWRSVLPTGRFLEVEYEDLVRDFDCVAKRIVTHVGLEWDEACRSFHQTPRLVRTASTHQVRQPLYQSSIRRWRPSAEVLRPLVEGIGSDLLTEESV